MSPSKKPFPIGSADQPKSDPKQQPIGFEYTEKRHCGLPYPASGQRSRPSVALHVCLLTGAPRRQRPGHCPLFHAPILPATPRRRPATSKAVGGDSLAHRPMAVALPESRSPVPSPSHFRRATAGYVARKQAAMGSRHRPGMAPDPAGDRPPRRRSNSDQAGKSTYSGKIESLDRDPPIATLVLGTRFPGN